MKKMHGDRAIHGDAFQYPLNRKYSLISSGIQYEFNPSLLQKRGKELAARSDYLIIQSGCKTQFEHEHNWILGYLNPDWPWFREEQTLQYYFENIKQLMFSYQTAILASNKPIDDIVAELKNRGFQEVRYDYEK